MKKWTSRCIESQFNKTILITQGIEGAGREMAKILASKGARVIICGSDDLLAYKALNDIKTHHAESQVRYEYVDMADLDSVRLLAKRIHENEETLDVLVNNSNIDGLMRRQQSPQGHELMFAVNYLSHFYLTSKLFSLLEKSKNSRIIFEISSKKLEGVIDFFDLDGKKFYGPLKNYAQSKMALLIFARELDRRVSICNLDLKSIPIDSGNFFHPLWRKCLNRVFRPSVEESARLLLFAATSDLAHSGHYYGLNGVAQFNGYPKEIDCLPSAKDIQTAECLWEVSEQMTGTEFLMRDLSNVLPFQMPKDSRPELLN